MAHPLVYVCLLLSLHLAPLPPDNLDHVSLDAELILATLPACL